MKFNIFFKRYFSKRNLEILQRKSLEEGKPLIVVVMEFCDFLMSQKDLSDVIKQYAKGDKAPDIRHLAHHHKVNFVKMRRDAEVAE